MKKKTVLESLKDSTKCTKYFFHFLFRFLLKTKKTNPPSRSFVPILEGGGSSAASLPRNLGCDAPIPEETF